MALATWRLLGPDTITFLNLYEYDLSSRGLQTATELMMEKFWMPTILSGIVDDFLSKNVDVGTYQAIQQDATRGISALATEMMSNSTRIFSFRVNPEKVVISRKKLSTVVLDNARYETQHWGSGNAMVTFSYSGSFTNLMPIPYFAELGIRDPRLSVAWINLRLFETFYKKANRDILMVYDSTAWYGPITDFQYTISGTDPWRITYTLNYQAYPESECSLSGGTGMSFDPFDFHAECPTLYPEAGPGMAIVSVIDIPGGQ